MSGKDRERLYRHARAVGNLIDPSDYRLIASMVAADGVASTAAELGLSVDEVRAAARLGAQQRSFND